MVLTANSHLFLGIDEDSMNQIIINNMRQRPSDFIWGTRFVEENLDRLDIHLDVVEDIKRGTNPPRIKNIFVGQNTPLEINVGKRFFGMDYWYQIIDFVIDLYPYNRLTPPNVLAEYKENFLIIKLSMLVGIGSPPNDTYDNLLQDPIETDMKIIPVTTDQFKRGTIGVYVAAHFEQSEEQSEDNSKKILLFKPDKIVFDLDTGGLNDALMSYFSTLIYLNLRVILSEMAFEEEIKNFINHETLKFKFVILPQSQNLPNNPKIEEDQLKLFVNWEVEESE